MYFKNNNTWLLGLVWGFAYGIVIGLITLVGWKYWGGSTTADILSSALALGIISSIVAGFGFGLAISLRPVNFYSLGREYAYNLVVIVNFSFVFLLVFSLFSVHLAVMKLGHPGLTVGAYASLWAAASLCGSALLVSAVTFLARFALMVLKHLIRQLKRQWL